MCPTPCPRILVVDDDQTARDTLRRLLEQDGYVVLEAEDGIQALEAYKRLQPDVILLDATMPDMNGFEICSRLQKLPGGDQTPVLMVTASDDKGLIEQAFKAGAADYVTQPPHPTVLRYRLRHLLRARKTAEEIEFFNLPAKNPYPVLRVAQDGTVLYANDASQPLLRAWNCQIGQPVPDPWQQFTAQALTSGIPKGGEITVGKQTLSLKIVPAAGARCVNVYGCDITKGVRATEALQKAGQELEVRVKERTAELAEINRELQAEIAERMRAEEALRESEERYRRVNESIQDIIYALNSEGKLTFISGAFEQLLGLSRDALLGKSIAELRSIADFPPEQVQQILDKYKEARETNWETVEYELAFRVKGKLYFFEFKERIHHDEKGNVIGSSGVMRDITKRVQAEKALQQRNRELALLHRAAQALSSTLDLDQVIVTVLEKVRHLLSVVASSVWLIDPETDELVCQQATGAGYEVVRGWRLSPGEGIAGWVIRHGESLIVADTHADERHFEAIAQQTGLPLRSILSVPLRVKQKTIGALQVVDTAVKRFSQADLALLEPLASAAAVAIEHARLYEETNRLRAFNENIVQSMEEGILLYDATGRITFINPKTAELVGYAPAELMGRHWKDCVAPEHVAAIEKELDKQSHGITSRYETKLLTRQSQRVSVIVSARPLLERERFAGALVVFTDITERKRVEEQIKTALREKEVLLKEVHHRVKNDLQIISSLLDLQSDYVQNKQALKMFEDSQNRVRSMALIHEHLYRSKDLARINFAEYIENLVSYLFRSYSIGTDAITLRIAGDDASLKVDSAISYGLIINELISNALKHAFPRGKRGEIRIILQAGEGRITLRVSDNGIGLPPDLDWHNTESLGLQLVNMLTDQLGGTIELDKSGGTAFTMTFPA